MEPNGGPGTGLTDAAGAGRLDPLLYPWDPPEASGVMDRDGFMPLDLTGLDEALAGAAVEHAALEG